MDDHSLLLNNLIYEQNNTFLYNIIDKLENILTDLNSENIIDQIKNIIIIMNKFIKENRKNIE